MGPLIRLIKWLWATDIPEAGPSDDKSPPEMEMPKRIVSLDMTTETGSPNEGEVIFATELGLGKLKNKIRASCGRWITKAIATCRWCGRPICSGEHFKVCYKSGCGLGLCIRCVHWFRDPHRPDGPALPFCPEHIELAKLVGSADGDW